MISLILIVLAAVFDAQRDKIQFDPKRSLFPSWDFWVVRNYHEKQGAGWMFDNVLSFANDGWHLCKTVSLLFVFTAVVCYSPIIGTAADIILFYTVYGIIFTIFYDLF